jgi:hypothetical protein
LPIRLSTTLTKIQSATNTVNGSLLLELYEYMKTNGSSESHMNNTLKTNSSTVPWSGCIILRCNWEKSNNIILGYKNEECGGRDGGIIFF